MIRPLVAFEAQAPARPSGEPPAWLTPVLLGLGGLHLVLFGLWLVMGAVLKPYSDTYSFIFEAWRWRDGARGFWDYLWAPHVGHHLVWVRLVTALEVSATRSVWPSIVACTLALLVSAAILAWRAWGDRRLTVLRLSSAVLCPMLVLTAFNALDADQPLNALYPFCLVFAVASLSLFEVGEAKPREAALRRVLGLLFAMAAALGNAAALALWPVLAVMAVLGTGKLRWLWAFAALAIGSAFGTLYLSGAGQIANLATGGASDVGPVRRVLYFFDYLALPWSQVSALLGAVLGVMILGLASASAVLAWRRGLSSVDRFALGLILFTVVTAALAAASRGGLGAELRVPMRYAVFAAPLQAGVVMLLASELESRLAGRGGVLAGVALAAAGLLLVQQAVGGLFVLRSAQTIRATIADYEAGKRTPIMTQLIYPDLIFVEQIEGRLKRDRSFGKAPQELAAPAGTASTASSGGRTP